MQCFKLIVRLICSYNNIKLFDDTKLSFLKHIVEQRIIRDMKIFREVDFLHIIIETVLETQ